MSFAIETILFGHNTKVNHMTNIILFILWIYLMYVFLLKFNLSKNILKFVLILIVVHPVFTSNVVYISPRGELFLAIFTILALLNIKKYCTDYKIKNLILAFLFFTLSLFTKESGIVLIITTPLFLYSLNKLKNKKNINLFFGFFLIFFLYVYLKKFSFLNTPMNIYIQNFSFILKNSINGFIIYINKLLIPNDIPVIVYNYTPDIFSIIVFVIFIILLFFIYLKNFINKNFMLFGILFFVLYLLPTFVIVENQIFFHRLLLPSLGLILIFILFVQKILKLYPVSKKYLLFSFIILFLFFSFGSFLQADKYKNNAVFVANGYKDAPEYYTFIGAMGVLYMKMGHYDKALEYFVKAGKYHPSKYLNGIGLVLMKQNKFDQAISFFNGSIEFNENKAQAYFNLSCIYEQKKDYKKSLEYAQKSYLENPYNIGLSVNLADKYKLNNEYEKAIKIYNELLKFKKDNSEYYYNIAVLYDDLKDKNFALKFINKAIQLDKGNQKYKEFLLKLSEEK